MSRLNLGARRPLSSSIIARLLAVLLVPVVVFAAPTNAHAATAKYGDSATASVSFTKGIGPAKMKSFACTWGGYFLNDPSQVDAHSVQLRSASCNTGFFYSGDEVEYDFTVTGPGCSFSGSGSWDVGVSGQGASLPGSVTDPAACVATEICYDLTLVQFGFDVHESGCTPFNLGKYPGADEPVPECDKASVKRPVNLGATWQAVTWDSNRYSWAYRVKFSVTMKPPVSGTTSWTPYVVIGGSTPRTAPFAWSGQNALVIDGIHYQMRWQNLAVTAAGTAFEVTIQARASFDGAYNPSPSQPLTEKLIGAGMVLGQPTDWGNIGGYSSADPSKGLVGVTRSSACAFYWGQKIAKNADNSDDPIGELPEGETPATGGSLTPPEVAPEPPSEDGSCGGEVSLTDPGSWVENGLCALGGLLGKILDALLNLFDAIIGLADKLLSGLLDLFKAAFVPDGDAIAASMDQVRDAFNETSPGKWTESLGSMAPTASAGGCQGPSFTVKIYTINEQVSPFAACSGGMATAANLVKLLLGLGVSIAGGLACIRGITSGLGWEFNLGRGADT